MRDFNPLTKDQWHKALLLPDLVNAGTKYRVKFYVIDETIKATENIATNLVFTKAELNEVFPDIERQTGSHWLVYVSSNPKNPSYPTISDLKPFEGEEFYPDWFPGYMEEWQQCTNDQRPSLIKQAYLADRLTKDKVFQQTEKVRKLQAKGVRGELSQKGMLTLFGCSHNDLIRHIEGTFKANMTWQNRGSVWHLDHIKPLVSFDLFDKDKLLTATHYTNLQALYSEENMRKYAN